MPRHARHVDLTYRITPAMPVWMGYGPPAFGPSVNPETEQPYTDGRGGFEATHDDLSSNQLGTLDPPVHWAP